MWYPRLDPVSRYWAKLRPGFFRFQDFCSNSLKVNCYYSRTIDDINMKLGPVTKLDKRSQTTSKKMMTSCRQIVTSLSFFRLIANLEQSRSRIPDELSVKLTFSLTVTFFLTKTENRTEKFLSKLPHYCSE